MDIQKARNLLIRILGGIVPEPEPKPVAPTVMVVTRVTEYAFQTWPETGLRHEPTINEAEHSWHDLSEAPEAVRSRLSYGLRYVESGMDWKILPPRPWAVNVVEWVRGGIFPTRYNWEIMKDLPDRT